MCLVSAIESANYRAVMTYFGPLNGFIAFTSGFALPYPYMKLTWVRLVRYLSPLYYCYQAMVISLAKYSQKHFDCSSDNIFICLQVCEITTGQHFCFVLQHSPLAALGLFTTESFIDVRLNLVIIIGLIILLMSWTVFVWEKRFRQSVFWCC